MVGRPEMFADTDLNLNSDTGFSKRMLEISQQQLDNIRHIIVKYVNDEYDFNKAWNSCRTPVGLVDPLDKTNLKETEADKKIIPEQKRGVPE